MGAHFHLFTTLRTSGFDIFDHVLLLNLGDKTALSAGSSTTPQVGGRDPDACH
jgi:hypothetical protein